MSEDDRPLAPRKRPTQDRAKQRIQRVLDATQAIIRRDGPAAVTTPLIAAESGVAVGSIYQYFPNKEAVILALYEQKLAQIHAFALGSLENAEPDWRSFFSNWIHRLRDAESAMDYDTSLNTAINHYPRLAEVSRAHTDRMADVVVGFLKHFGSPWPDEALFDLAIHAYYINSAAWLYWAYAETPLPQGVSRLVDTLLALLAPAFERAPPPPPYVVRRAPAR